MARRSQHSFLKRQKEIKRKDEAVGKMARRQGKAERPKELEEGAQLLPSEKNTEVSS
jgi:hypothetical protein